MMQKGISENRLGAFKKEFSITNVSIFDEKYQVVKRIVDANNFELISKNINLICGDKGVALSSSRGYLARERLERKSKDL